jgi:transposase
MKRETRKLESLFPNDHSKGSITKNSLTKQSTTVSSYFYIEMYVFCLARILEVLHVQKKGDLYI